MAKSKMFMGKARGKVGGVVFRVVDGKQVMSELNDKPFNPKSEGQSLQRFKFAFVQAIASQIPSSELEGLGGRPIARRSEMLSAMIKSTTIQGTADPMASWSANLNAGAIPFARGPLARPWVDASFVFSSHRGNITGTLTTDVMGAGVQVRCAIIVLPNQAVEGEVKPIVVFADAAVGGAQIEFTYPRSWNGKDLNIQVVSWLKAASSSAMVQNYLNQTRGVEGDIIGKLTTRDTSEYMYSTSQLSVDTYLQPA